MLRRIQIKRRMFIAVMIFSGTLTAMLGVILFASCSDNEQEAVQVYEATSQNLGEDMQVLLSMGEKPNIITVSWKGKKGREYFRYGRTPGEAVEAPLLKADKDMTLGGKYRRYSVLLEDLERGQEYYYEIGDGTEFRWSGTFKIPADKKKTTLIYMGDVQATNRAGEYAEWGAMLEQAYEENPELDFAVAGGDMINNTLSSAQWNSFFGATHLFSRLPLMPVPGNHEGAKANSIYKKLFALPMNGPDIEGLKESFYYFDYGHCRFIMLDSSFLTDERKEKMGVVQWEKSEAAIERWLGEVLHKSRKSWNIVVVHHPPYGLHDYDTVSPDIRKLWTPIMEKGNVDLALSGHQHMYMRTRKINGITYIMGNSGNRKSRFYTGYNAPLYAEVISSGEPNYQIITADRRSLKIVSKNKKGLVIDETLIEKELRFHIFEFFSGY